MKEKIGHILSELNRERIAVSTATEQVLGLFSGIRHLSDEDITKIAKDKYPITNNCFGEHNFIEGRQEGFEDGIIYVRDELLNGL